MNLYEAMFILEPDVDEEGLKKVVTGIEEIITSKGGVVEDSKTEGKKNLAYPIRKKQQGIYHLIKFSLVPEAMSSIDNAFKLNDNIYRVIITKKSKKSRK